MFLKTRVIFIFVFSFLILSCENEEQYERKYPDGTIKEKGIKINGKIEGKGEHYAPDGKLDKIGHYKNGVPHGEFIYYYPNGNVREKFFLIDTVKEGKSTLYYEDGHLMQVSYYKNDEKKGNDTIYQRAGYVYAITFRNEFIESFYYNEKKEINMKQTVAKNGVNRLYKKIQENEFKLIKIFIGGDTAKYKSYLFLDTHDIKAYGNINFLTKEDSMHLDKYYPDWSKKIVYK